MKLKLNSWYNENNPEGKEFEVLDIKNDIEFSMGIGVLVLLDGEKTWLTISWFTQYKG